MWLCHGQCDLAQSGRVAPDDAKLAAVAGFPRPATKKELQCFLCLVGYHRCWYSELLIWGLSVDSVAYGWCEIHVFYLLSAGLWQYQGPVVFVSSSCGPVVCFTFSTAGGCQPGGAWFGPRRLLTCSADEPDLFRPGWRGLIGSEGLCLVQPQWTCR